ncbi:hypothetical protein GCM10009633_21770 [Janibacter melonis]
MGRKRRWTDDQLAEAVESSTSVAQVIGRLGIRVAGGNYAVVRRAIAAAQLDTSHFTGQAWNKGLSQGPTRPLDAYLSNEHPISSYRLKNRLVRAGIFTWRCDSCGGTQWLGLPIPLELEHRDGDRQNNSLENLELLCPNCHAQTPTYRGRNRRRA